VVEKRATWSLPVPLDDVKAVSRKTGASVNDVLLTAVTGALRRYLLSRGTVEDDLAIRGVVPVNLRRREDAHLLGNRFGLVFVPMPVGVADPTQRLHEVGRRMQSLKQSQEPFVTFQILRGLGLAPRPVFDFVVRMFGRKATAVVTNVIGPREAVTFGGVRLGQVIFWVPCAGKLGLGISILSYAGRVSVGFATDAGLIPDPDTIVKGFDAELGQLLESAREQPSDAYCLC
jgi:WS/DGAT/MGAT family acyltransferase